MDALRHIPFDLLDDVDSVDAWDNDDDQFLADLFGDDPDGDFDYVGVSVSQESYP